MQDILFLQVLDILFKHKTQVTMEQQFLADLAQASNIELSVLNVMYFDQLVDNVILPRLVVVSGQDTRGWRIHDQFMSFMAKHGQYCLTQNAEKTGILLEIALQRISHGAVLHEPTRIDVLPEKYAKYSVRYDQHGLMSNECWDFLVAQTKTCLALPFTAEHIKKIVFGLFDHIAENGERKNNFLLGGMDFRPTPATVRNWCKTQIENFPVQDVYEHYAKPELWEEQKEFFKKNWRKIDENDFFKKIGKTGFFEKRKIRKELKG